MIEIDTVPQHYFNLIEGFFKERFPNDSFSAKVQRVSRIVAGQTYCAEQLIEHQAKYEDGIIQDSIDAADIQLEREEWNVLQYLEKMMKRYLATEKRRAVEADKCKLCKNSYSKQKTVQTWHYCEHCEEFCLCPKHDNAKEVVEHHESSCSLVFNGEESMSDEESDPCDEA